MKIKKQPKVSAITVVAHRSIKEIEGYLRLVEKISYPNFELILLINNEHKKYAQQIILLSANYTWVRVINNQANLGFCAGANIGIKSALKSGADYTLLLNDDVIVKKNIIEELLAPFLFDKRIGLVSPIIMQHPDQQKIWYAGGYFSRIFAYCRANKINQKLKGKIRSGRTGTITGCCAMIKKEVWQKVGYLDEDLFMYFDDPDLSLRARKKGFSCYLLARPLVVHLKKSSLLNSFEAYYYGRNPFILIRKHYPGFKKITAYFGQFFIRLPRNLIRLKDQPALINYLKGIRDGLRGIIG